MVANSEIVEAVQELCPLHGKVRNFLLFEEVKKALV